MNTGQTDLSKAWQGARMQRDASRCALLIFSVVATMVQPVTAAYVFWIDNGINDAIYRADLDGSNSTEILSNASGTNIAVDPFGQKIYWSKGNRLRRANFDGSNAESLLQFGDARDFHGLAFDSTDPGTLYYALSSGTIGEVSRIGTDGTGYQQLYGGGDWFDVVADPGNGTLVLSTFTVSGDNPRIYRAAMDGSWLTPNTFPRTGDGAGLAIHADSGSLFWTGPGLDGTDSVWRSNLDGSNAEVILGRVEDMQVFGDKLYYAQLANPNRVDLWRANLDGTSPELVVVGSGNMTAFAIIPEPSTFGMFALAFFAVAGRPSLRNP